MAALMEQFKSLTRYWWAMLLLGVATFILGILIFVYPGESYIGMAALFAVLMLLSGIVQLVIAFTEKYMVGRGWSAVLGVLEVLLGIMLIASPGVTAVMLPIVLGIWLLFRGIGLIGIASEMNHFNVPGMGWTIALGILLIIGSLLVLFQPLLFGMTAVVVLVGIAFLVAGVSITVFAFQLFGIKNKLKSLNL